VETVMPRGHVADKLVVRSIFSLRVDFGLISFLL
jgi:hypothetical protein